MIEPLHGVTRDTAGSHPAGERRPAAPPVAPPLPSRRAAPPAGPDLGDHRYAALAAWSASAETITMGAVEAGHGGAYPLMAGTNPQPGTPHPAGPPPAPERLRTHRAALLAVLAILAALVVVEALVLWRR